MNFKKQIEVATSSQNLYVVFDIIKNAPDSCMLAFNDVDFVRCNLPILHSRFQLQDIEVFNLGPISKILEKTQGSSVDWSCYRFETEAENLSRLGMKQDEIEAYFAEKSKKNRGMTESQIISIMKNYISNNSGVKES